MSVHTTPCPTCSGNGHIPAVIHYLHGVRVVAEKCTECAGAGFVIVDGDDSGE